MAELKYVIFFFALVVGVPAGIVLANKSPLIEKFVVFTLVLSTVIPDDSGINFCSREFYFSMTKGFEISLGDLAALVLLGVMHLQKKDYQAPGMPPLSILFLLIILSNFASWVTAPFSITVPDAAQAFPFELPYDTFETKLYPLFETSKWIRGLVLFLTIYYYLQKPGNLDVLAMVVCLTTLYLGLRVLGDRYIHHIHRVKGTLQHPNSLATYMAMCATFLFCILLAETRWKRVLLYSVSIGLAGIAVIMTISRGGLGALILGLGLSFMLLGWRYICVKNVAIVALGAIAGVAVLIMAADTLLARFVGEQDAAGDLEYRMYYNMQGMLMAKERIFGVGAGNFSALSWDRYAAMVDPDNPAGTPAHNIWYLTLGETGYPGLVIFMVFWLRFFAMAGPLILWRLEGMQRAAATGATLLCFVCHVQAMVQLSFRQSPIFFMLIISVAIVAALQRQWQDSRKAAKAGRLPQQAVPA